MTDEEHKFINDKLKGWDERRLFMAGTQWTNVDTKDVIRRTMHGWSLNGKILDFDELKSMIF